MFSFQCKLSFLHVSQIIILASRYENPLVTTTSRAMLADILRLSGQLTVVNVPRPLAVIYSFFRLRVPDHLHSPWIHALRAWTDIDDISESESFGNNPSLPSLILS